MRNPFRHHGHGGAVAEDERAQTPGTTSAEPPPEAAGAPSTHDPHSWQHMQQDVDPDCVRDPGSDLVASWNLEHAAAEEALEADEQNAQRQAPDDRRPAGEHATES